MEEIEKLYKMLKKFRSLKGIILTGTGAVVDDLLAGLLKNRKKYGYMGCPCRLLCGDREKDKDSICPCVYRKPDVEEFGSCYCALYVSDEWNKGRIPETYVPERRPDDKMVF